MPASAEEAVVRHHTLGIFGLLNDISEPWTDKRGAETLALAQNIESKLGPGTIFKLYGISAKELLDGHPARGAKPAQNGLSFKRLEQKPPSGIELSCFHTSLLILDRETKASIIDPSRVSLSAVAAAAVAAGRVAAGTLSKFGDHADVQALPEKTFDTASRLRLTIALKAAHELADKPDLRFAAMNIEYSLPKEVVAPRVLDAFDYSGAGQRGPATSDSVNLV